MGRVDVATDSLSFEQLEEALRNGVVVTVSPPAHAADDPVCPQECLPLSARVLAALI